MDFWFYLVEQKECPGDVAKDVSEYDDVIGDKPLSKLTAFVILEKQSFDVLGGVF